MRIFLIVISFVNALFYVLVFAYFDNILEMLDISLLSGGFQNFIKIIVLVIVGFCIGAIALLFLNLRGSRSYFDMGNLVLLGIIPFILLILSLGPVLNFITNMFSNNTQIQELIFYLFSRQTLWSLWLGFSIGTSVRPCFKQKNPRHIKKYEDNENIKTDIIDG